MKKMNPKNRKIKLNVKLTMLVVGFFFCLIIIKLCYVVLAPSVDGIDLTSFANNRNTTHETLYASRGIIYDKDGKPLAKNANSYKVVAILSPSRTTDMANPQHVVDKDKTATSLCGVLASEENKTKCIEDIKDEKSKKIFQARFFGKNGKKQEIHSQDETNEILENIKNAKYIVTEVKKGERRRTPAPPFTTSTMQQEASRKLGFTLKKTMSVAQGLYEGVKISGKGTIGLITYMRTDSTRISEEARAAAKEQIMAKYGEKYYENRYYKTGKDAQDAHEGIRPTYINIDPDSIKSELTPDQYKLYRLIYNRFMASQMKPAIYDTMAVNIKANEYDFKANGQNLRFKGFMTLYVEGTDGKEEQEEDMLPELIENQEVKLEKINPKQSFTEPPARYTEASLVKALEEKGIGRPSTYSPTITTILERRYIEKLQKQLHPTELGRIVNKLLIENFSDVINVEFTARIENEFDEIAEGKEEWKKMIREFYGPFEEEVEKVEKELEHVKLIDEVSDVQCEKCGRMMVYKYGRYGKFLACPGFPECRNIKPIVETIDVPCPKCGAKVQVRKTKRRKNYYICENNPKSCDYISWNKPKVGEKWNPEDAADINTKTEKAKKSTKKVTKTTRKTAKNKTAKSVKTSKSKK